jgi:hypothetical protein
MKYGKHMNYKIKWTQPYTTWNGHLIIKQMEDLKADLIERVLDYKDFTEANEVIAKIKAL